MTHGEEPGPETPKDSAVLTYLEGLLMHPVAAGPGATATIATRRSDVSLGNQDQVNKLAPPFQLPHGPSAPKPGNGPSLGASQNLKKARLLCSGAWNQAGSQRLSSPPAELNGAGQGAGQQNGGMEGSPHHGGESTLLASLLQSFSSRLQSVAMSQQGNKPTEQQQHSPPPEAPPPASASSNKDPVPVYGTASSRLKGLMRKSKLQNHSSTPYSRRGHGLQGERPSESPRSGHAATPPSAPPAGTGDAVSCAERLKAVANLVKIRSSPAPSPKPSVACSQLALLLSSEAHLQQYSREHALKAQLTGRSASERLAAMATQQGQEKRPPSTGETTPGAPDALSSLTAQNGTAATAATTLPRPGLNSSQRSPSLLQSQTSPRPIPPSPRPMPPSPPSKTHSVPHSQAQFNTSSPSHSQAKFNPHSPSHSQPPFNTHSPSHAQFNTHSPSRSQPQLNTLSPSPSHSQFTPHPLSSQAHPREKRGFDSRPSRPPQTCSSLLLLLLNNHNSQKQLTKNGHLEDDLGVLPPSRGSSVTSDSECSTHERKQESSDAESSYSSCSPIDLSMRGRNAANPRAKSTSSTTAFSSTASSSPAVFSNARTAFSPPSTAHNSSATAFSSASSSTAPCSSSATTFSSSASSSSTCLDKLTESLINKWKPEPCGPSKVAQTREFEMSPDLKSHPKVTLMQLLLERRNNDNKVNKMAPNPVLPSHDATPSSGMARGPLKASSPWEEGRNHSPLESPLPLPLYSLGRDQSSTPSPFSFPSPQVQSSPLDLCKSKPSYPAAVEKSSEPAFSASKLLQNLAQCGTASPSPPTLPSKPLASEELHRPHALLERLNAPIQRKSGTPMSEGPSGSGTPFGRREMSPPSTQIENLLERRTVLQLLLGTGAASVPTTAAALGLRDSRSTGGSGRQSADTAAAGVGAFFEKKPHSASVICDSSDGPAPEVKVKTEPAEEVGVSPAACEDAFSRKRRSGHDRFSPVMEPQQELKTEPRPAEVIAKYGLLSQLLKQQTATYYTSSAQAAQQIQRPSIQHQVKEVKEVKEEQREQREQREQKEQKEQKEQREHKDHMGPSPKRKRLCPELAESLSNGSPPQRATLDRGGSGSLAPPSEELGHRVVLRSPKHEEEPPTPPPPPAPRTPPAPLVRSPPRSEALPRESRGFNVLKQLLLSDNCLKELSQQPRTAPSPSPSVLQANGKANGSVANQPSYNHDLLHLPWHPQSSGPSPLPPSPLPSHLRPLLTPPAGDSSHRSPWGRQPPAPRQDSPKRDPPPPPSPSVKREPESPVQWGRGEEEQGPDSSPDSPRLTRSNPILYYMLQKGSAQLRREMMRDQGEGPQGQGAGLRVKEEPVGDMHAYDHRLTSNQQSPPPYNNKHSQRGQRLSQTSDKW